MWVRMFLPGTEDQHIFPVPDAGGHRISEDGECPCGARRDPECPSLVMHRSRDHREAVEEAEALLKESGRGGAHAREAG